MRFKIIFLVFLITLSFGCATKKPIDYNSAMEDTGSVELDADFNGAVDVDKGGTNVQTYSALKVVLSLDQVDNTADIDKPVSTLTQTEIDTKEDTLPVVSEDVSFLTSLINGVRSFLTIAETKTALSLNNVDNTSDANKPVSTLTQSALDLKADQGDLDTTNTAVGLNTAKVTEQDTGTNTGNQEGDGVTITGAGTPGDPFVSVATGTGDVVGPGVAIDSNLPAFDTTTGKLIKDSLIAIANIFTLGGTQTVTGDKTFTGLFDTSGTSSNTSGPIVLTPTGTLPAAVDGKIFMYTGLTGFLGNNVFGIYDGTTPVYYIGIETPPTTTGETIGFNSVTGKWDIVTPSGGASITEVATAPDPWDLTPGNLTIAQDTGTEYYLYADGSKVITRLADTSTDLFDLTLTVAETDGSTVDINGTSYGDGGPYTISSLTGSTAMDISYVTADTTDWTGTDSGDVTGATPNFFIDMTSADKTLIATISDAGPAFVYELSLDDDLATQNVVNTGSGGLAAFFFGNSEDKTDVVNFQEGIASTLITSDDAINTADNWTSETTTITFWYRPVNSVADNFRFLTGIDTNADFLINPNEFFLYRNSGTSGLNFAAQGNTGVSVTSVSTNITLVAGTWYEVTVNVDATANPWVVSVDVGGTTVTWSLPFSIDTAVFNNPLRFGGVDVKANHCNGNLDYIRVTE